jgi:hypothetical protein
MVNYLLGLLLKIFHYIIIPLIFIWTYFYSDNFLLNIIILFIFFIIIIFQLVFSECPLTPIENYLMNNKKTIFDFIIEYLYIPTDYNNTLDIHIFGIKYTIFKHHLSIIKFLVFITIILYFIKIYYLYLNKNINV